MTITGAQILVLAAGAGMFLLVFELVRRRQLREKYAALWFVLALGLGLLAFFPKMLDGLGGILGIVESASVLFFVALIILLMIVVHLSWEMSRLESETRVLSEDLALLRLELERRGPQVPGMPDQRPDQREGTRDPTSQQQQP